MSSSKRARAIVTGLLTLLAFFAMPAMAQETITYTYDALGRLTGVSHGSTGPNANASASYTYDPAGNRSNVSMSAGGSSTTLTLSPATLPNGTVGSSYSKTVTASGGSGGYTYAVSVGSLPTSLSLNGSTGAITGTPSVAGAYSFTINATDSSANSGTQAYSVTIGTQSVTLSLSPTSLSGGTVGTPFSATVTASGGSGGYTYAVSSGALPTSLSLNGSTGAITGTPSVAGTYSFTIKAADSSANTGTRAYGVTIASAPSGPVANNDSASVSACGTVTVNVTANDTDPNGYALTVTSVGGGRYGTPNVYSSSSVQYSAFVASGSDSFTYTITDGHGGTASATVYVTISGGICP